MFNLVNCLNQIIMSIGSIYETAYKGDFNQTKVRIDADKSLINTPDEVME